MTPTSIASTALATDDGTGQLMDAYVAACEAAAREETARLKRSVVADDQKVEANAEYRARRREREDAYADLTALARQSPLSLREVARVLSTHRPIDHTSIRDWLRPKRAR